ncbi:hypothetical protein G9463_23130 [Haloarcula sp. JP-Z28]|uniref:hypothetical protein n=1 Tax=Haloarcula sp. JP-Z28 TaxID=2716715 RepID=UPI00140555B5|nr:hypothetical protein [Haloarcula sp. JP-Z28]NHN66102.1 hypothetical protein [Haloarcula sp. JP-Z28]
MNRRNVLTGLGGLAISGGALFGTGAFTSVSATRSVEVNVFGDSGDTEGVVDGADEKDEKNIAETITGGGGSDENGGAVDVLINTADSGISVKSSDGNSDLTADELFPSNDSIYSTNAIDTQYVSLVANDVTIAFGDSTGLPPNSSLEFGDLFAVVPNTNQNNFTVRFESDTSGSKSLLKKINGTELTPPDNDTTNDPAVSVTGKDYSGQSNIQSGDVKNAPASVDTTTSDNTSQTLDITIE